MDGVSGEAPFNLFPLEPILVWLSLSYRAPIQSPGVSPEVCPSPFLRAFLFAPASHGAGTLPTEQSCLLPFPSLQTGAVSQAPILLFSHVFRFCDFSYSLGDDSPHIRLWFGLLDPYLHGSFHTVNLVIPSKFIVSALAHNLTHLPLFSLHSLGWTLCFLLAFLPDLLIRKLSHTH